MFYVWILTERYFKQKAVKEINVFETVLGQLSLRKIVPKPKANPNLNRGQLSGVIVQTILKIPSNFILKYIALNDSY